jgi:K+-sensing histidine kinase KdpD
VCSIGTTTAADACGCPAVLDTASLCHRFWQSDQRRGSGLGLAISQQLAKINHGEIALLPAMTGGIIAVVTLEFAPQSQLQPSAEPV